MTTYPESTVHVLFVILSILVVINVGTIVIAFRMTQSTKEKSTSGTNKTIDFVQNDQLSREIARCRLRHHTQLLRRMSSGEIEIDRSVCEEIAVLIDDLTREETLYP